MLDIRNLTIFVDQKKFIDNLSFSVGSGDKLAIIGEEGNGKSTLAKVIAQKETDYAKVTGQVNTYGHSVGYLEQILDPGWQDQEVYKYFIKDNPFDEDNYDNLSGLGKISRLLSSFGLNPNLLERQQTIGQLSGGEKVKLQLVKVLRADPDILVLDEPTNDLDLETLMWLENFILSTNKPIIYISHDEELLEKTANAILHIEQVKKKTECRCTFAKMSYSDYIKKRQNDLDKQTQIAIFEKKQDAARTQRWQQIYNRVNSELNSISRRDPSGGRLLKKKMKSVKSQEKRFERERKELTDIPDVEEAIYLYFGENSLPNGKNVCDIDLEAFKVGERELKNIKLNVTGPKKVTIIGKNGVGKTTFIKYVYEMLKGRPDLVVGYMPQNYDDAFSRYSSVMSFAAENAHSKDEQTMVRTLLACLKFTDQEVSGNISELSGGQKAKLYLARLMASGCNVLILDEPTRNLSPLSNPVIRQALGLFGGAIISVSHDRKYISQVSNLVLELTENGLADCTEKFIS